MITLTLWTLAQFGLAYIVGHSAISLPFRVALAPEKVETVGDSVRTFVVTMLECPACFGFWAGAGVAALGCWQYPGLVLLPAYVMAPAMALATSGSNYLLSRLAGLVPAAIQEDDVPEDVRAQVLRLLHEVDRLEGTINGLDRELRPMLSLSKPTASTTPQ